jgi:hypothetical protein
MVEYDLVLKNEQNILGSGFKKFSEFVWYNLQ